MGFNEDGIFNIPKVKQINGVHNQYEISTSEGIFFQSYDKIIAFISKNSKIILDKNYYNYSKTTSKYLNIFLNIDNKTKNDFIKNNEVEFKNLNI